MKRSTERVRESNSFSIAANEDLIKKATKLNRLIIDTQETVITNSIRRLNEIEILCRFALELSKDFQK